MSFQSIDIEYTPKLVNPMLICGFGGWGNALNVSKGMAKLLIRRLKAEPFARVKTDAFYRFDENRPVVKIENGRFKSLSFDSADFYATNFESTARDVVILKAEEPQLNWNRFVDELFTLSGELGVDTIITLGSMYDSVLHTDRVISGIASHDSFFVQMAAKDVLPIYYSGPSAIHSLIHAEGIKKKYKCASLWYHCPYYLQGTTHHGALYHLGSLLAFLGGFELDLVGLEERSRKLNKKIETLIDANPELQRIINEVRKAKVRGSWESLNASPEKTSNVINLKDFLEPK